MFQLNSCFEPLDSVATQAYGFDQMAALYGRYKVHRVTVGVHYHSTAAGTCLSLAVRPPEDSGSLGGQNGALQAARSNVTTLVEASPRTNGAAHWQKTYDIYDILGISKKEYEANIEEYSALVGANPSRIAGLEVGVWGLFGGSNSMFCLFTVVQEVEFSGRLAVALS